MRSWRTSVWVAGVHVRWSPSIPARELLWLPALWLVASCPVASVVFVVAVVSALVAPVSAFAVRLFPL
jgi:hypothetical protein